MHVYFSGIGGAGIGPLALIAHQAGFIVSGSDKQDSLYVTYLRKQGITNIHIGQTADQIAAVHARQAIDWFVYSSALSKENADHPELQFCHKNNIRSSKRDAFLSEFIQQKHLKLIAIAGTHGKTTTTAMAVWLCKQLGVPISYSVGAKLSFGEMGEYNPKGGYFIYEADEYDRNFLSFYPYIALLSGLDWDHPDTYPDPETYNQAFRQFIHQSEHTVGWADDLQKINVPPTNNVQIIPDNEPLLQQSTLRGSVNRQNALLVATALHTILNKDINQLIHLLNMFPGLSRRFEEIAPNLYTDYAHTPPKIKGALQMAHEVAGKNVVVVYEGLHNTRQHFIKEALRDLFDSVKQLYIVPSYLAREDPNLALLSPAHLKTLLSPAAQTHTKAASLDAHLYESIKTHLRAGDLVLCLSAGGGGSLDEWLRKEFAP